MNAKLHNDTRDCPSCGSRLISGECVQCPAADRGALADRLAILEREYQLAAVRLERAGAGHRKILAASWLARVGLALCEVRAQVKDFSCHSGRVPA